MARGVTKKTKSTGTQTVPYKHPEAKSLMRPEVGTQAQFKKKKPQDLPLRFFSLARAGLGCQESVPRAG